jgi:hypothetical protein
MARADRLKNKIDRMDWIGDLGGLAKGNTITNCGVLEMEKTPTNTAWSIYWAPPSARFVTISARCDSWH